MLRRITMGLAASLALAAVPPASAQAKDRADCGRHLERAYSWHYKEVRRRHGVRAPGRDIRANGVVRRNQTVRKARCPELRRSLGELRQLLTVPKVAPNLVRTAGPPARMPSGVQTPHVSGAYQGGWAIPTSIVMCESGGSPTAVNTGNPNRPAGAYQIITSTWLAHGGGAYAPTADAAPLEAQHIVAARIYAGGAGRGQWEC